MKTRFVLYFSFLALMFGAWEYAQAAPASAAPKQVTKAAFVKGGDLWIANGRKEKKMAGGPNALMPGWSSDGSWIAYAKGDEKKELWLLNEQKKEEKRISEKGGDNFQWSPSGSRLAYLEDNKLLWMEAGGSRPTGFIEKVGNYGWLPDGSGFIVSSVPELLGDNGWAPIRISTVSLTHPDQLQHLYTIPSSTDKDFAVETGRFKWSSDGKWVAFQAVPTASLSADSNSLCVLSADGKRFLRIGYMVRNEAWFQWSPGEPKLAFIEGVGREATSHKRLTVVDIPADKPVVYTPAGDVDRDFAWQGDDRIIVSRAKESEWTADPDKRPLPHLVQIDLKERRQTDLTPPPATFGDYDPAILARDKLAWVRSNRKEDNQVLRGTSNARRASVWIKNIDKPTAYYEQFYWSSVLDIFSR